MPPAQSGSSGPLNSEEIDPSNECIGTDTSTMLHEASAHEDHSAASQDTHIRVLIGMILSW